MESAAYNFLYWEDTIGSTSNEADRCRAAPKGVRVHNKQGLEDKSGHDVQMRTQSDQDSTLLGGDV